MVPVQPYRSLPECAPRPDGGHYQPQESLQHHPPPPLVLFHLAGSFPGEPLDDLPDSPAALLL